MTELRSWVAGVLVAVTVAIAIGACVQIARADTVVPSATVAAAPRTMAPASSTHAASSSEPPSTTTTTPTKRSATTTTRSRTASVDASRCTNRIDYTNDPRDNATINSIGEQTGRCPVPVRVYQEADDRTLVEDHRGMRDANGETYAQACRRMGYEPGPTCPAG
ncbi:hypothetical protein [Actinomycetospora soli]|uniref:hypothetical protein n=1 Tax=Actinomycetospora soli TaxID=2893887 RepID=UPI001E42F3F9|nr:hypothetical protein [Actinomycetospora soli]MCD2186633.1 hypothetical protein [Actinomycetospora soli]